MLRRRHLFVKVCGMRDAANVAEIAALGVSRIGFIFYPASPRYVGKLPPIPKWHSGGAKRIGVFVDSSLEGIVEVARQWSLDGVQLHGSESAAYCRALRELFGGEIVKAIGVGNEPLDMTAAPYHGSVDLLLFDTAGPSKGGTGRSFDWEMLRTYHGDTPFVVAGGLDESTVKGLRPFVEIDQFVGIDLNSKVEDTVGIKNPARVREVLKVVEHELLRRRRGLLRGVRGRLRPGDASRDDC